VTLTPASGEAFEESVIITVTVYVGGGFGDRFLLRLTFPETTTLSLFETYPFLEMSRVYVPEAIVNEVAPLASVVFATPLSVTVVDESGAEFEESATTTATVYVGAGGVLRNMTAAPPDTRTSSPITSSKLDRFIIIAHPLFSRSVEGNRAK
jgi:hypothetical protein